MMRRIAMVMVALSLVGSDCERRRVEELDEGLFAEPEYFPWSVVAEPELELQVENACSWWNDEMSRDGVVRVVFLPEPGAEYPPGTAGVIPVSFGYIPLNDDETEPGGVFDYGERDGLLVFGSITVSADFEYHTDTVSSVLRHELGHALGLADDPNSIDLNSVMSYELAENGALTDHDFDLVAEVYDAD